LFKSNESEIHTMTETICKNNLNENIECDTEILNNECVSEGFIINN